MMNVPLLTAGKRFLRSPRVIIAELVGLALAGTLGAALPQVGTAAAPDLARLQEGGPLVHGLVAALALDHIFRSPGFLALTVLAAGSLAVIIVEQVRRLRRAWSVVLTPAHFRDAPLRAEFERPARSAGLQEKTWTRNRLALAGSPMFHAGLLLVLLAGAARALFGVDAAVDVLEGETIAPVTQDWAAQWPGLLGKPFKFETLVTLAALRATRYEAGDLRELKAQLVVSNSLQAQKLEIAVNRDAHLPGGRVFLTTEFGPAALLEWQAPGGRSLRQAALLTDQGRGTFEGSVAGPGGLVAHLRAQVDPAGSHPSLVEVRVMKESGLLLTADARIGDTLALAGGQTLTLRGTPFWARLRGSRDSALGLAYVGFGMVMLGAVLLFTLIKVDGCIAVTPLGERERVFVALKPQRFAPLFQERFKQLVAEQGGADWSAGSTLLGPSSQRDEHHSAQGCAARATLGNAAQKSDDPERVVSIPAEHVDGATTMHPLITTALLLFCLVLSACRPSAREQAHQLVTRYNQVVSEAYRRGDVKLIDPVVGPNEGRKLTGLIGVRLDMGLTLDSQLLSLEVTRVEQEPREMRVWTRERWRYCDRRIGTGQPVGEESIDTYEMLYLFKQIDRAWLVDEIKFNAPPQVGRQETPWPMDPVTQHAARSTSPL
jgi:hypothetical protein